MHVALEAAQPAELLGPGPLSGWAGAESIASGVLLQPSVKPKACSSSKSSTNTPESRGKAFAGPLWAAAEHLGMEAICLPCNPGSQHRQRFGMCAIVGSAGNVGLSGAHDIENALRQPSSESAQSGLLMEQRGEPSGLLQSHYRSANGHICAQPAAFAAEEPGGFYSHSDCSQRTSSPSSAAAAAPMKEASAVTTGCGLAETGGHLNTTLGPKSSRLQPLTGRLVLAGTDGVKRPTLAAADCNQGAAQAATVVITTDERPRTGHITVAIPSGSTKQSPASAVSDQQPYIAAAELRPLVGNLVFAGARAKAQQIAAMQDTQQADEAPPPALAGPSTAGQTQLADYIHQGASGILLLSESKPTADATPASGKMQPVTGHLILPAAARPPVAAVRQPQQAASAAEVTPEVGITTDGPTSAVKSPIAAAAAAAGAGEQKQPGAVSPAADVLDDDVAAALGLVLLHAQPADAAAATPSHEEKYSTISRPQHVGPDQDPLLLTGQPSCKVSGHQAGPRATATSAAGIGGPPGQQGFARHQGLAGFGSPNKHRAASARIKAAKKQSHRFLESNADSAVAAADRHQHRPPVRTLGAADLAPACDRKPGAAAKAAVAAAKTAAAEPSAAAVLLQKVQSAMQRQPRQLVDDTVLMLAAAAAPWYPPACNRGSFLVQKKGKLVARKMYALPAGTAATAAAGGRSQVGNNSSSRGNILLQVLQQQMQQDRVAGYGTGQDDCLAGDMPTRRTAPVALAARISRITDAEMEQKLKVHQAHSAGRGSPTYSPLDDSYSQQQELEGGLHDLSEAATTLVQAAAAAAAAEQDEAAAAERRHNPRRKRKMPSKLDDTFDTDCALQLVYGRGPRSSQAASAVHASPQSTAAARLKKLLLLEQQQQQQPMTDPVQHLKEQLGNAASFVRTAAVAGGHGGGCSSLQNPKQQQQQQQVTWQQYGWWVGKSMCQRDMHRQWWDWAEQEQQQIEQQQMEELLNRYVNSSTSVEPNLAQQPKQQQQVGSSDQAEDHQHEDEQQRSRLTLDEVGLTVWSCLARQPSTAAGAANAAAHQGAPTAYKQLSAMASAVHRAATACVSGTSGVNPALAAFMLPCKTLEDLQRQHVSRIDDSAASRPLTRHATAAAAARADGLQVSSSKATTVCETIDAAAMAAAEAVAAAADAAASRAARHAQRTDAAAAANAVCKKRPAADTMEPLAAPVAEQPAVDVARTGSQRSNITDDTDWLFESIVLKKRCLKDQLGAKSGSCNELPFVSPQAAVVDITDSPVSVTAFKLPASILAAAAAATAVPAPWKPSTSKPPMQGASVAAYKQQRRRKKPRAQPPMLKNQQQIEQLLLYQQDLRRGGSVPADVRRQQQQQLQELMQRVTQQQQQEQQQARVQALMLQIQAQQRQLQVPAESSENESPRVSKEHDEQPQRQPGLFRVVFGQGRGQQQQQQMSQQQDQQGEAAAADQVTANGHSMGAVASVMNTITYGSQMLMPSSTDQQQSQLQYQPPLLGKPIQSMQTKPVTSSSLQQRQQHLGAASQPVEEQLGLSSHAAKQQLSSIYPAGRAQPSPQSQHLHQAQQHQALESAAAPACLPVRNVQHQLLPQQQPFFPQQPFCRQQHNTLQRVPHSMTNLQLAAPLPAALPSAAAVASSGSASAAVAASRARLLAALEADNDAQPRTAAMSGVPAATGPANAGSYMAPAAHMRPLGAGVTTAAPVQVSAGMSALQAGPVTAVSAAMPAGSAGVMYVPYMPVAFMQAAGMLNRFPPPPPPPPPRLQHRQQ